MPTLEIDGRSVTVEAGLNLVQAADRLDIEIPHYCYHAGLSIAGNCRMCLVEIEKVPKLQIACNMRVAEGMVVRTRSPKVEAARRGVLEFLLLNHPIDCPVCDQAGECKLQDYYMEYGGYRSRMSLERKVHKGKAIDIGGGVMLDQERCILCSRCVRFLDEITGTSELAIFERGDRCTIDLFAGARVDNAYSGNLVDVCPVGALTDKQFRFQSRVWYLERTPSVCAECSRGCNIDVYHRGDRVFRVRPRYNPSVNEWWMCDAGREVAGEGAVDRRLTQPLVRQTGGFAAVEWEGALDAAVGRLRGIVDAHGGDAVAGVASARATNEEIFLLTRFLCAGIGAPLCRGCVWSPPDSRGDDFLICADKNPNARGLDLFGLGTEGNDGIDEVLAATERGEVRAVVLLRADLVGWTGDDRTRKVLEAAETVIVLDSTFSETAACADVVLALGAHLETQGTVTNCQGHVQRISEAVRPPGDARAGWWVLAELVRRSDLGEQYDSAAAVFAEIGKQEGPFRGLTCESLGAGGVRLEVGAGPASTRTVQRGPQ